jgi:DNA-binding XRE family transcriptional regulator
VTREEIIQRVSERMRLIRTEAGYTQDKMSEIIGLSKKTLVQIEKERATASWSTVVTVCALFRESETVQFLLGNDPLEVLETIAREGIDFRKQRTLGGKVWWREITSENGFTLQQNIISSHFRILDHGYYRIFSSFDESEAMKFFNEVVQNGKI